VLDAAAGFERHRPFVAVEDAQIPARAIAERGGKLFGEMRDVDDDFFDADRREFSR
jgi:hypothetical protein